LIFIAGQNLQSSGVTLRGTSFPHFPLQITRSLPDLSALFDPNGLIDPNGLLDPNGFV
jgi:hypothetical protein